jgi:hypothetical protein
MRVMPEPRSQRSRVALFYSVFAGMFVVGIVIVLFGPSVFPFGHTTSSTLASQKSTKDALTNNPIREITTTDDWKAATATGRCILFVDCVWNPEVVAFRRRFSEFAAWSNENTDYKTIRVTMDPDLKDELSQTIQILWKDNSIARGGMKNYGGAGRVVWFDHGRLIDYAWCMELLDANALKSRTTAAFR